MDIRARDVQPVRSGCFNKYMKMKRLGGLVLPAVFLLAACGGSADSDSSEGSDNDSTAEASSESTELPGGKVDEDVLPKDLWFTDDGLLRRTQEQPGNDKVQKAFCEYLFGTPEEVAETAGLTGDVEVQDAGYLYLGDDGEGFQCVYEAGDQGYGMRIWSKEADFPGEFSRKVTVEADNGNVGVSIYSADFDGDALDEDTVKEWLTQAAERAEPPKDG